MQNVSWPLVNVLYVIDHADLGPRTVRQISRHRTCSFTCSTSLCCFCWREASPSDRWRSPRSRTGDRWATLAGAVAAMLFAVHPMMTGAVGVMPADGPICCRACSCCISLVTLRRWLNTDRSIWLVVVLATFLPGARLQGNRGHPPRALPVLRSVRSPRSRRRSSAARAHTLRATSSNCGGRRRRPDWAVRVRGAGRHRAMAVALRADRG